MTEIAIRALVTKDEEGPKRAAQGQLFGLTMDVPAEGIAVLGAPEDGTIALFDALVGRRAPSRGSVRIGGGDPFSDPALRARVGSLGMTPMLPPASTVGAAVAIATGAWRTRVDPAALLQGAGLAGLAARRVATLTEAEARSIELAIALAVPEPALYVLFEPFAGPSTFDVARVADEIAKAATRAPVVVITSLPADAQRMGKVAVLHRGFLARTVEGSQAKLGPAGATHLTVWVASGAGALAAALSTKDVASSVALDRDPSPSDAGVLRVAGPDESALALAIADATRAVGASVLGIAEASPGLAEVRAATDYELRARQLSAQLAYALEARARADIERARAAPAPGYGATPAPAPFGATPTPPPAGGGAPPPGAPPA